MSERHWQRPALASTALALLGATAVAGCGGSASSTSQASATHAAGMATATGPALAGDSELVLQAKREVSRCLSPPGGRRTGPPPALGLRAGAGVHTVPQAVQWSQP